MLFRLQTFVFDKKLLCDNTETELWRETLSSQEVPAERWRGGGGYIYNMQWLYINIQGVKELSA